MSPFSGKNLVSKKYFYAHMNPPFQGVTHIDFFIEKSIENSFQFILVFKKNLSKSPITLNTLNGLTR
jgi:hypothetical protein